MRVKTLNLLKTAVCFLSLCLCVFFVNSCATIVNGDMVSVPVYTTPAEATLVVNGCTYKSPATVLVPRGKGNFKLHIEKEGFEPVDILLTQSVDGWVWGNLIFGGIIGLVVDFASGDAYDLEPELVSTELKESVKKADNGALTVVLVDINQLPEDLAKRIRNN